MLYQCAILYALCCILVPHSVLFQCANCMLYQVAILYAVSVCYIVCCISVLYRLLYQCGILYAVSVHSIVCCVVYCMLYSCAILCAVWLTGLMRVLEQTTTAVSCSPWCCLCSAVTMVPTSPWQHSVLLRCILIGFCSLMTVVSCTLIYSKFIPDMFVCFTKHRNAC